MQMIPYICTNILKSVIDIRVGIPQNFASHAFQILIPEDVLFLVFLLIVLRTIQFYNDF